MIHGQIINAQHKNTYKILKPNWYFHLYSSTYFPYFERGQVLNNFFIRPEGEKEFLIKDWHLCLLYTIPLTQTYVFYLF